MLPLSINSNLTSPLQNPRVFFSARLPLGQVARRAPNQKIMHRVLLCISGHCSISQREVEEDPFCISQIANPSGKSRDVYIRDRNFSFVVGAPQHILHKGLSYSAKFSISRSARREKLENLSEETFFLVLLFAGGEGIRLSLPFIGIL